MKSIKSIAADFVTDPDEKAIDFSAAGLYLPGIQSIFATVLEAAASVLACWLIPARATSAIRTLACVAAVGVVVIRRPINIGASRGVGVIFSALRPCPILYLISLVLEQLVHTCVSDEPPDLYSLLLWRKVSFNACTFSMLGAGMLRARSPRGESDTPFLVWSVAAVVLAVLPPPALLLSGPLCAPPTLLAAGERILRAFLFAAAYTVHVYAASPISPRLTDTVVCIVRSGSASSWILGISVWFLPLAVVQIVVVLYNSFASIGNQYEGVLVDPELGSEPSEKKVRCSPLPSEEEPTPPKIVAQPTAAANGAPLSFNLTLTGPAIGPPPPSIDAGRMAEIAAGL